MPIIIAICDDAAEDIALLSEALRTYDGSLDIISYTDGRTFLDEFPERKDSIDILFLDIYMPGIDGIRLAELIRAQKRDIRIIFITASSEHYPQAYDLSQRRMRALFLSLFISSIAWSRTRYILHPITSVFADCKKCIDIG